MASIGNKWNRCEVPGCKGRRGVGGFYCKVHRSAFGSIPWGEILRAGQKRVLAAYQDVLKAKEATKASYYNPGADHEALFQAELKTYETAAEVIRAYREQTGAPPQAWIEDEFDGDTCSYALYVDGKLDSRHWYAKQAMERQIELGAKAIDWLA